MLDTKEFRQALERIEKIDELEGIFDIAARRKRSRPRDTHGFPRLLEDRRRRGGDARLSTEKRVLQEFGALRSAEEESASSWRWRRRTGRPDLMQS